MNAQELFYADGRSASTWLCAQCGKGFRDRECTERCCRCLECKEPIDPNGNHFTYYHRDCQQIHSDRIEQGRFDKAELVECYDGWVYADGYGSNDGYFPSMDELLDYLAGESPDSRPEFVFCCTKEPLKIPDVGWIIERATGDGYEDMADAIGGEGLLQDALDDFAKVNEDVVSYQVDYTRKVRVPTEGVDVAE